MKLILAIVQRDDAQRTMDALVKSGFRVTKLASTGGLLRKGNTTIISGVEEAQVERALEVIEDCCEGRTIDLQHGHPLLGLSEKVHVGGAVVFIVDVESFVKL